MYGLNRFEASNYVNGSGDSPHLPWIPRFAGNIFPFHGLSTAIRLDNGGGKTRIANAIVGLLGRDQKLLSQVYSCMPSSSTQSPTWGHVRLEFIECSPESLDVVATQGVQPEGETWVFGLAAYQPGKDHFFYFYRGTFEDAPTMVTNDGKKFLVSRDEFRASVQDQREAQWNVVESDWRSRIFNFVSKGNVQRLTEYQKSGSGDQSAQFFRAKPRGGERFDQAFFYENLAPEIMSGLMGDAADEDEQHLEDTLYKTLTRSIRDERLIKESQHQLEECERLAKTTRSAAETADRALGFHSAYRDQQRENATILAVINRLVRTSALPGIPRDELPNDPLVRALAVDTVIAPQRGVMFRDSGLAYVCQKSVKELNQIAERWHLKAHQVLQVIESTHERDNASTAKQTVKPRYYTPDDAHKLIAQQHGFFDGASRAQVRESLYAAVTWIIDAADCAPRRMLSETDADIAALREKQQDLQDQSEKASQKHAVLQEAQNAYEEGEKAYSKIKASPLFEPEEADRAAQVAEEVSQHHDVCQQAYESFTRRESELKVHHKSWQAFTRAYGDDADPSSIHSELKADRDDAKQALNHAIERENGASTRLKKAYEDSTNAGAALEKATGALNDIFKSAAVHDAFTERFPGEAPSKAEATRRDRKEAITRRLAELVTEKRALDKAIDALFGFRTSHGQDADPTEWLAQAGTEREQASERRHELRAEITELERQLEELKQERVAAAPMYRESGHILDRAAIHWQPLHKAIIESDLAESEARRALEHFSAIAFAPVVADPEQAEHAAQVLADARHPVPTLIQEGLIDYLRQTHYSEAQERYQGLLAGVMTREVACLLDPSLIERERRDVEERLGTSRRKKDECDNALKRLDENGRTVKTAREAEQALATDAERKRPALEEEQRELEREAKGIDTDLSEKSLKLMRGAQDFLSIGGAEAVEKAKSTRARCEQAKDAAVSEHDAASAAYETAQETTKSARDQHDSIYTSDQEIMVKEATRFFCKGGPQFWATRDKEKERLSDALYRAIQRGHFKDTLQTAGEFVAERDRRADGVSVHDELASLTRALEEIKAERKGTVEKLAELEERRPNILRSLDKLDEALAELQSQDRLTADLAVDIDPALRSQEELTNNELVISAENIMRAMRDEDSTAIFESTEQFLGLLRELELTNRRERMTTSRKNRDDAARALMVEVQDLRSERNGLAATEREMLAPVASIAEASIVTSLAESYAAKVADRKEHTKRMHEAAQTSMDESQQRMAQLIASAETNLRTLQRVLNSAPNENAIRFDLRVKTPTRDEALSLVQHIREAIQPDAEALAKKQASATKSERRDDERRIRQSIRERCYRTLFTEPSLGYASPIIRPDGNVHRLTPGLSTGQRTSLTMAMLVRLTEYSMQRDSAKYETAAQRKRARENQQTLMVIDGLFSDLSKPKLIEAGLNEIQATRGHLQLIGLIHPPQYVNDFDYFPMYLVGQEHTGNGASWTEVSQEAKPEMASHVSVGKLFMSSPRGRA
ncbi:hypothetical protein ACS8Y6_17690 [Salinisphaera sp. RV14]|uniref:hypothetical protein n=1 Tax=unclassified Salinisphaera TaxID=2649847 RepID=UPI003F83D41C